MTENSSPRFPEALSHVEARLWKGAQCREDPACVFPAAVDVRSTWDGSKRPVCRQHFYLRHDQGYSQAWRELARDNSRKRRRYALAA